MSITTLDYAGVLWDRKTQERFWGYVRKEDSCWEWTGTKCQRGYGRFSINNRSYSAHRLCYVKTHGDVDRNDVCDHLCRNPGCVNPKHVEPVSQGENVRRGMAGPLLKKRNRSVTHCPKGHEYSPENTRRNKKGHRTCRTCQRRWAAEYKAKIRTLATEQTNG